MNYTILLGASRIICNISLDASSRSCRKRCVKECVQNRFPLRIETDSLLSSRNIARVRLVDRNSSYKQIEKTIKWVGFFSLVNIFSKSSYFFPTPFCNFFLILPILGCETIEIAYLFPIFFLFPTTGLGLLVKISTVKCFSFFS